MFGGLLLVIGFHMGSQGFSIFSGLATDVTVLFRTKMLLDVSFHVVFILLCLLAD